MALADALTHRKTRKLATTLKVPLLHALGIIEALFIRSYDSAPRGDIGRLSNADIALDIHHDGDPDELIAALVMAGFLDEDPVHRLIVHDWHIHCNDSTNSRVARSGLNYASGAEPRIGRFNEKDRATIERQRDLKRPERDAEDLIRDDAKRLQRRTAQSSAEQRTPHLTSPHLTSRPPWGGAESQLEEPENQLESPTVDRNGLDNAQESSVSSITLTTRIDADDEMRTAERDAAPAQGTTSASDSAIAQPPHKAETRAREAARSSAEQRRTAQSSAAQSDDDPRDPGMVARGVMDTLRIVGRWTLVALEKVCRLELNSDPEITSSGLHDSMVQSYKRWQHERPDIFANWKTEDFFGDGHWRNPENWPRRSATAPSTKSATPTMTGEELMRKVREVHGPAPQHEGGKKNGSRTSTRATAAHPNSAR